MVFVEVYKGFYKFKIFYSEGILVKSGWREFLVILVGVCFYILLLMVCGGVKWFKEGIGYELVCIMEIYIRFWGFYLKVI